MATDLYLVGLGPGPLDRLAAAPLAVIRCTANTVIVRTGHHPGAADLSATRDVVVCDDLYDAADDFDDVYQAIVARVIDSAKREPTVYAVPGSVAVGERAIPMMRAAAAEAGLSVKVFSGESFLDLLFLTVGLDPIADGLQLLDGRALETTPDLTIPTVITQVDRREVADRVAGLLAKVLEDDFEITIVDALGNDDASIEIVTLGDLATITTTPLTSVYVPASAVGLRGLIAINEILRRQCPWDKKQTHRSLLRHLIEETYEVVEALEQLSVEAPEGDPDWVAYSHVEEELGDVLLQVVFHATLASEAGAFTIDQVAEGIRRKLVYRHPHVFGDVAADDAEAVIANWEALKASEKRRESLMDDIPLSLPSLARADKTQRRARSVGFDFGDAGAALDALRGELNEFAEAGPLQQESELGDVLFAVANIARHVSVDAESALRGSITRFEARFRWMESAAQDAGGGLESMSLDAMDELWQQAKGAVG